MMNKGETLGDRVMQSSMSVHDGSAFARHVRLNDPRAPNEHLYLQRTNRTVDTAHEMLIELQNNREEMEKYIAVLCHELRTPLNGTMGTTQALMERVSQMPILPNATDLKEMVHEVAETGNPAPLLNTLLPFVTQTAITHTDVRASAEKIYAFSKLQLATVEDLLDHTRAKSGLGTQLENIIFDLDGAVNEAIECVKMSYSYSNVVCRMDYQMNKDTRFTGDRRRIVQMLINLLSNAVKASKDGGTATIRVREGDCSTVDKLLSGHMEVYLEVIDDGTGMSQSAINKNFKTPFTPTGSSVTTTGLGFGIVRHVVTEILGGKISVESTVGKGCTVQVALMLRTASEDGSFLLDVGEEKVDADQIPILIVDDHEFNVDVLQSLLQVIGHVDNVDVAYDGDEALLKIDERYTRGASPYNLVLMDVSMANLNGDEAVRQLRDAEKREERTRTRVVGLSAYANASTRETCLAVGMDEYCTKPMQLNTLKDVLKRSMSP